jgi:uncharacterized membrane protein (UPF0127 family)
MFSNYNTINLSINGKQHRLWVADNDKKRHKGLSGVNYIPKNTGMIFTYKDSEPRDFSLKRCKFPIHVIFLNSNGDTIRSEMGMPNQNNLISCNEDCKYVIEIPV